MHCGLSSDVLGLSVTSSFRGALVVTPLLLMPSSLARHQDVYRNEEAKIDPVSNNKDSFQAR